MKLYREVSRSRFLIIDTEVATLKGYEAAVEPIEITEVIGEVEDMHPYKQWGDRDSYSQYNEGWSDACDVILSKLKGE